VGLTISPEGFQTMFPEGKEHITFEEFLIHLESQQNSELREVVNDIIRIQKALLATNNIDPRDDITQFVKTSRMRCEFN